MSSVLWYVHDVGSGHLHRAAAVLEHLDVPAVVAAGPGIDLSRLPPSPAVRAGGLLALPSDVPAEPTPTVGPWHWAPASPQLRARADALAAAIARYRCTTAVVDVSAEVAVLARMMGLRVVALRQSGRRDDDAHRIGFASADAVWVPQHPELDPVEADLVGRAIFTGAFSRFDRPHAAVAPSGPRPPAVTVLVGAGGHHFPCAAWRTASASPSWPVVIAGLRERWHGDGICSVGHVDVEPLLRRSAVVVTAAGWASVADAAACGARLVVVAEPRPFDEQVVRAEALAAAGLAVHLPSWPTPAQLPAVIERAMALAPDAWAPYYDGRGAQRAADLVEQVHAA
jgi:hypothetical protein